MGCLAWPGAKQAWPGGAGMAGYQTGYHPQRTLVNGGGLSRTDRQVSGVYDERQWTTAD